MNNLEELRLNRRSKRQYVDNLNEYKSEPSFVEFKTT